MDNQGWQKVESPKTPTVRWEATAEAGKEDSTIFLGNVVQGIYVDVKRDIGANKSSLYMIETPNNGILGVWGSQLLDDKMSKVKLNNEVRITFKGMEASRTKGYKPWKNFEVEQAVPVTRMQSVETQPAVAVNTAVPTTSPTVADPTTAQDGIPFM